MERARPWQGPGDPYGMLGVSADASQRDIARAYRRAVQRAHPDARPDDRQAAARFQVLTDAYDLLRDPGRRADYDRGHPAGNPSRQPPAARTGARPQRPGAPFLLGPPPGQLIWAGPVHVEPPTTTPPASPGQRKAPTSEFNDPVVILGMRPGQVWGWPW